MKHLLIIGAQRSGTTYLYKALDAHPDIYMAKPIKPEPKYFMDADHSSNAYGHYFKRYFVRAGNVTWLGEKSTSYLESAETASAIKRSIPDATIIVMLRNPVERAISHYAFTCEHGLEPYAIERAFREESLRKNTWHVTAKTSVTPYAYTERGKYIQYLEPWERLFGRDRLIILIAERFFGSRIAISELYRRLCIDPNIVPCSLMEQVNSGPFMRTKFNIKSEFMDSLQQMYSPWNRMLEERYGLDLSCWNNVL